MKKVQKEGKEDELLILFVAIAGSEIVKLQRETIVIQAML